MSVRSLGRDGDDSYRAWRSLRHIHLQQVWDKCFLSGGGPAGRTSVGVPE